MKRRIFQFILVLLVLVGAGLIFYFYCPQIWGEVFYPLKYREEILAAEKEFGIPRNLIAAVIFSESHFNSQAASHTGALGLMQLMPATARGVAKEIGLSNYTDSQIFNPAVNIRLGTAYIKLYWDLYNQDLDAVLVAYNAGPAYLNSFIQNRDRNILPRETTSYLRRTRSAWRAYDRIYGVKWQGGQKNFAKKKKKSFVERIDIFNLLGWFRK